jgi:thimet oligopeptidase
MSGIPHPVRHDPGENEMKLWSMDPAGRRVHLMLAASVGLVLLGLPFAVTGLPRAASAAGPDAAEKLQSEVGAHLEKAQQQLDAVMAVTGERTVENTLEPMNRLSIELSAAGSKAALIENVHPDKTVREAAEKASQDVSAFITELSLNRDIYDALAGFDASSSDAVTQRLHDRSLRDYRRAGVDKDEATRNRIKAIREELVEISQEFSRNIREGQRSITVDSAADLKGLPQDYIDGHEPGEDGKITLTTAYPDYIPILQYAENATVRQRLHHEFNNRGYPQNKEVFSRLLAKRFELAQILGYKNYAEFITADKMAKNPGTVQDFIQQLDEASTTRAMQDYSMLLDRKRKDSPSATQVYDWEKSFYSELVKEEQFDFDSQVFRAYFNYPEVKTGILGLCSELFGVSFKKIDNAETWHADVEHYEMLEDGKVMGRFYLDMHPRDGKYSHAAQFPLQTGIKGLQEPQAVLVCNFPKPDENGLGLMSHDDVETFLHEFGHLLHTLFGGHQRWADQSGIATEWDFVEAPSQMLEEWSLDAGTLRTFAKHHETGEMLPVELVDKLRRSRDFGNGIYVKQQNFYSAVSLYAYNQDPSKVDMDTLIQELQKKYSSFNYIDDTHMYTSFGHLDGYSAIYYTYMWSLVIAKDLFSKFDTNDMLNRNTAMDYRKSVLEPGGTKDAEDLVKDFLGRPYGFESFARWLNGAS